MNSENEDKIPLNQVPEDNGNNDAPPEVIVDTSRSVQAEMFQHARADDWERVFWVIESRAEKFSQFTQAESEGPGQNILQRACSIVDESRATEVVTRLFSKVDDYTYSADEIDNFVNFSGPGGETALHIAISRGNKDLIYTLLRRGADVNLRATGKDQDALYFIYDKFHKVMLDVFDKGLKIDRGKFDSDNEKLWMLKCDFSTITGLKSKHDKNYNEKCETSLLATVVGHPNSNLSEILLHPLVQLFLHEKGARVRCYIWISIILHIIWSFLSILFIVNRTQLLQVWSNDTSGNETCKVPPKPYAVPEFLSTTFIYIITVLFYFGSLIKEIIERKCCPTKHFYWNQYVNICEQILLVVCPLALGLPYLIDWMDGWAWSWLTWILQGVAVVVYHGGIFAALLLVQGQSTKMQTLGIYNEMLLQTFIRFSYFIRAFAPMLIAFMFTFAVLLHQRSEFDIEWGLGISKVFAMLTGELNYNDITECVPYPMATKLVFLFFIVCVVILLQNMLIGLTVEDLETYADRCMTRHLASRLQVIYLIERFLTSGPVQWTLRCCKSDCCINRILVGPASQKQACSNGAVNGQPDDVDGRNDWQEHHKTKLHKFPKIHRKHLLASIKKREMEIYCRT